MTPLGLRYEIFMGLTCRPADSGYVGAELLGPQGDGTVRMKINTVDPMGEPRVYTVTIKED